MTARRGGKVTATREAMENAAMAGQHVHHATHGGSWCLTRQPIGFLYARLPRRAPPPTTPGWADPEIMLLRAPANPS